jgi:hypothetical protein
MTADHSSYDDLARERRDSGLSLSARLSVSAAWPSGYPRRNLPPGLE